MIVNDRALRAHAFLLPKVGLAVVTVAVAATPAHAQPPSTPCDRPAALVAAGFYADGISAYKRLLGTTGCATPDVIQEARAAQNAASPTPMQRLAVARRLQDAGFDADARKIVQAVVTDSSASVDPELREPDQRLSGWRGLLGLAGPWVRTAAELAAVLAIIVLFVIAARIAIKPRWQLGSFDGGGEHNPGAALSARLGAVLRRMSDDGADRMISFQSATEASFDIPPEVTAAVPHGTLVSALLKLGNRLIRRKVFTVGGALHPIHPGRGAGLTVTVTDRHGRTIEQATIWERDCGLRNAGEGVDAKVRYERLMLPAAIWLGYRRIGVGREEERRVLGTRDWRSYALFAVGELVPDAPERERMYELALDRDDGNHGARLNLAATLLAEARPSSKLKRDDPLYEPDQPHERCARALRQLGTLIAQLGAEEVDGSNRLPPIWYRAHYLRALAHVSFRQLPATLAAREDVIRLKARIDAGKENDEALDRLLSTMKGPLAALELLIAQALGESTAPPPEPQDDELWRSAATEYTHARYWAGRGDAVQTMRALRRAIPRSTLDVGHDLAASARAEPDFAFLHQTPAFVALTKPASRAEKDTVDRHAVTIGATAELLNAVRDNGEPHTLAVMLR